MQKKNFGEFGEKFGGKKILAQKKQLVKKNFGTKKIWCKKFLVPKKV